MFGYKENYHFAVFPDTHAHIHSPHTVVPEETQENGKTPEGVPNITVEEPLPEEHVTPSRKRKESKVSSLKPTAQNKLPDHGVEMKGYIYRKKPGLGNRWDKTYCIVTYQAVYFTTVDDNKEYNHMLPLSSDITGSVSPRKGHDKSSQVHTSTHELRVHTNDS